MENINTLLSHFDSSLDAAEASTAPASWYTSPAIFEVEKDAVRKKAWQFVAPKAWFKKPGDYWSGQFLNEPFFILMDQNGELNAYYNVCRHHAACIFEGQGNTDKIVCPYHGWSYNFDGSLAKAPFLGPVKNFKKDTMGLKRIALKTWGPFVLLNFSYEPAAFPDDWQILYGKMNETEFEKLNFICRRTYEFNCNWKVYVDNYLDGGYHVDILHKGLANQLDMQEYKVHNYSSWTLQTCEASKDPTTLNGDFKDRIGRGALYAWLYPNFVINRYGPIMDTNWIVPLGKDKCVTIFDYYYSSDCTQEFIDKSLKASDRVQEEDIQICESVQRGLNSSAYHVGRYSATLETGMHLFHKWLHQDLSAKR